MNTAQEAALALGVVALIGVLMFYNVEKMTQDNDDNDSCTQPGEAGVDKLVGGIGRWFGVLPQCTSKVGNGTGGMGGGNNAAPKRVVRVFTGYGSKGPATCDPNDETCDDDRDRDCDVVLTQTIALSEADIAAKRAGHWLIESDADIEYLKNRCKQEQAARHAQIEKNRDEQTRYTELFTRLNNQFAADTAAGRNPNKLYTPEALRAKCTAAQLGSSYTQKVLDSFASSLASWNRRILSQPPSAGYPPPTVHPQDVAQQIVANWKEGIDKARPYGPWPNIPTYESLMNTTYRFTPAQAHDIADTLQKYLDDAKAAGVQKATTQLNSAENQKFLDSLSAAMKGGN
jgi:hypothetical protein